MNASEFSDVFKLDLEEFKPICERCMTLHPYTSDSDKLEVSNFKKKRKEIHKLVFVPMPKRSTYSFRNFLNAACYASRFDLVKYLYTFYIPDIDLEDHSDDVNGWWSHPFISACISNNAELVQWLMDNTNLDITAGNGLALYVAAKYEYRFELLKLLYNTGKFDINSYDYPDGTWTIDSIDDYSYPSAPFRVACLEGNLKAAKFLYSTGKVDIKKSILEYENLMDDFLVCEDDDCERSVLDTEMVPVIEFLQSIPQLSGLFDEIMTPGYFREE